MMKQIRANDREALASLRAGEKILLSGTIYTARDAAHKRIFSMLREGQPLPFDPFSMPVYYAGPTQTPPGRPIGSCGPTTASRMAKVQPTM